MHYFETFAGFYSNLPIIGSSLGLVFSAISGLLSL
ncbi:hypothetical protein CFAEC_03440 [Corynebacterium faecale]|nr:hypothetical protein CFAEC_03440 [Corynebacterium faecale]